MTLRLGLLTFAVLPIFCVLSAAAEPEPSFEKQVAPLLQSRCLKCHNSTKARGNLDLSGRAALLKGGETGAAVAPGKSGASLLFAKVQAGKMPPGRPLGAGEVELLRRWIDVGVPWPEGAALKPDKAETGRAGLDWWSLQPIRRPAIPSIKDRQWVNTPVDGDQKPCA